MKQVHFKFKMWGGKRRGAGAKRRGARRRVRHERREKLNRHCPVHVTLRMCEGVENRRADVLEVLKRCFERAEKEWFRVGHYSLQGDHMHLIVEADDARALARGMQGLNVRMARGINRVLKRKGKVFADRYHAVVLRSPRQTASAVRYVLRNREHHLKIALPSSWRDPYAAAVAVPKSWLLARAVSR